jgi:uncharacterized membrane protein YtjA (UPF0391 family)
MVDRIVREVDGGAIFCTMFLVGWALIAGILNVAEVAAKAVQISWILFVIGIVLIVIHMVTGHRTPVE